MGDAQDKGEKAAGREGPVVPGSLLGRGMGRSALDLGDGKK